MIQSRESTIALYTREMVAAPPRAVLCRAPTGCIAHSRRERAPCRRALRMSVPRALHASNVAFFTVLCGTRMWYSLLFCYLASLCRLRSVMGFFYFETTPVRPRRRSTDDAGAARPGGRAGPPAGARAAARAIARPPRPVRAHTRSARRDRYPITRSDGAHARRRTVRAGRRAPAAARRPRAGGGVAGRGGSAADVPAESACVPVHAKRTRPRRRPGTRGARRVRRSRMFAEARGARRARTGGGQRTRQSTGLPAARMGMRKAGRRATTNPLFAIY